MFLLIAGKCHGFAGSVGGSGGILVGCSASFLPQPVQTPNAYFLSDDTPPRGLLSPDKDEDGRRDGTRLKAPSQVLTRATRTMSVLHALAQRLRDFSLHSLFLALIFFHPPSAPSPRVFPKMPCSPYVLIYALRFRKDVLSELSEIRSSMVNRVQ